ncbi:MAG: hypothetical protein K0R47_1363 [Brevibacillus sp.]|jgi:Ca2+/Na+ antiporter|nr:hypothetical protein [Brevibacillus sp.]
MAYAIGAILWFVALGYSIYIALNPPIFMPEIQYYFSKIVAITSTLLYFIFLLIVSRTKQNRKVFCIVLVLLIISVIVLWPIGYFKIFLYGIF